MSDQILRDRIAKAVLKALDKKETSSEDIINELLVELRKLLKELK